MLGKKFFRSFSSSCSYRCMRFDPGHIFPTTVSYLHSVKIFLRIAALRIHL